MSDKSSTGEKPGNTGLGFDQSTPPKGEAGGTPGEKPPAQGGGGEKAGKPNPKIGLERYLQNSPQNSGITNLLRLKHKADVKTIPEWEAVVTGLLKKKIQ